MFFEYLYVFVFLYLLFNIFMTRCDKWFMFNPKKYTITALPRRMEYINQWGFRWHHLYTGIIIMEIGNYFMEIYQSTLSIWYLLSGIVCLFFGFYLWADDLVQHREQRLRNNPEYHTFGHKIGKPFYHFRRWLIKITGWKWLGKI